MRQRMQLTGTNHSIGLIALINNAHRTSDAFSMKSQLLPFLRFAGLVVMARSLNPIPFRTRPLNSSAPMVLCLKTRESRSLPGLQNAERSEQTSLHKHTKPRKAVMLRGAFCRAEMAKGRGKGRGEPGPSRSRRCYRRIAKVLNPSAVAARQGRGPAMPNPPTLALAQPTNRPTARRRPQREPAAQALPHRISASTSETWTAATRPAVT